MDQGERDDGSAWTWARSYVASATAGGVYWCLVGPGQGLACPGRRFLPDDSGIKGFLVGWSSHVFVDQGEMVGCLWLAFFFFFLFLRALLISFVVTSNNPKTVTTHTHTHTHRHTHTHVRARSRALNIFLSVYVFQPHPLHLLLFSSMNQHSLILIFGGDCSIDKVFLY